ncbi:RHS repeat-associated core domain-containing protein [Moraxella cuniculi DSM 21768]|uniref:RHS repeat-associated core domain-containing protein n=1 Tax=Moraxella cuniculi DSM 21768 TaxID=1122245 RepID=A0A1N7FS62_9GAMM|nr:RHS repeat-associated core domain-containing protein [Moraxella cuniculi DSM 21768]
MGRLTQSHTSSPNHIIKQAFYRYDKKGQLTQLNTSTRLGQQTRNVPMGQAHPNQAQRFNRTHQYIYDKVGRLTEHKLTDHQAHTGHTEVFGFDPASNRVPLPNANAQAQQNTQNKQEQRHTLTGIHPKTKRPTSLISQNKQISYTYDSHGNIKTKTETPIDKQGNQIAQSQNGLVGYRKSIEFSYNSNNELAKTLTLEDTGLTITKTTTQYHYDAFGRRIAKNSKVERLNKLNQNGQLVRYPTTLLHLSKTQKTQHQTTLMLWEGNRQLQEYTDKHIFTTIYDQDSFEPVSRIVQARNTIESDKTQETFKIYHYHNNHLGTPQELTDENGKVVWLGYDYAWGGSYQSYYKEKSLNNCAILEHELQPIRFQGQSLDIETGLHYNRFRYYDSDVGMFISRDPIGLLGGNNVFAYAPNPIGWVDPLGLKKKISFGLFGDHARRHGNGLNPTQYRIVAEKHLHCSQIKVKFRHNKMTKLAHITKVGEDLFVFTSSNLSKTRIYTHMQEGVNSKYLQNIGITLPKKLSINC